MGDACSNVITSNPADIILFVFALIVLAVLVWCIRAFFYAIFSLIFSKWDKWKFNTSVYCIRYMIIWLFLTVMVLFVAPTLLKVFGVPNPENYSAKFIFVKVGNIISCVSTWITKVVTDYPNNNPFGSSGDPFSTTQTISTDSEGAAVTIYQL